MMEKFIQNTLIRLFNKVYAWSKRKNINQLHRESFVHETTSAHGVVLKGKICIENNTKLSSSSLNGQIDVKNNTRISDSWLSGDISIGENSLLKRCKISGNVRVGKYARLLGPVLFNGISKISIGSNTSFSGPNIDIKASLNEVHIGNFCSIARNTSFQEYHHRYHSITTYLVHQNIFGESNEKDIYSSGDIEVGHDVWIGAGCIILSGAKIGSGAVIAANSVVSKEIPPYAIAGGSQAKVIKYRFEEKIIDSLLKEEWWYWSHDKIKRNKHLFEGNLTIEKLNTINN